MLFGDISSMRAFRAAWGRRPASTLTAGLLLAGLAVSAGAGHDPARAAVTAARAAVTAASPAGTTALHYQGYTFDIPASWTVIRLAQHPDSCVRFDEHVVYLGTPGTNQSCPSWLFGTTEAVLIEPAARRGGRTPRWRTRCPARSPSPRQGSASPRPSTRTPA